MEAAEQSFVANLPKKLQYQGVVAVLLQAGFECCICYMCLYFSCNFQKLVANDCRIIDLFATVAIMKTRKDEHTKTQNKDFKEDYKMERTANNIVKKMEETGILMSRERTFNEYVTEITQFQEMICKIIAGDAYHVFGAKNGYKAKSRKSATICCGFCVSKTTTYGGVFDP